MNKSYKQLSHENITTSPGIISGTQSLGGFDFSFSKLDIDTLLDLDGKLYYKFKICRYSKF